MFIYILVFVLIVSILLISLFYKKYRYLLGLIVSLIVVIFESVRWKTGTDWYPYFDLFLVPEIISGNEPLYYYLNLAISKIFGSYNLLLLLISAFSIFAVINLLREFKLNLVFGVLIYISLFVGYWGMNRQMLSVACALFMYSAIIKRNNYMSIIWFILGFMFHNSAGFLIVFLLFNTTYIFHLVWLSFCVLFIFFKSDIFFYILGNYSFFTEKLDIYTELESAGNIVITIIRRTPILLLIIFSYKRMFLSRRSLDSAFVFFSTMYILSFVFTILMYQSLPIFVNRFSLYFLVSEIFLVPYFFKTIENYGFRILYLMSFISFYCYIYMNNINYNRDLYIPYISIFEKLDRIMY